MMSRLRKWAEQESKLEMTPMIDVTFLLLIFFMCTIQFKTLEGKLAAYLPKDLGGKPTEAERKEKVDVLLRVIEPGSKRDPRDNGKPYSGAGTFQWGPDRVIEYRVGPSRVPDLRSVEAKLEQHREADPERGMTINPLPGVVNSDVMQVLDAAIAAGFTDITFKGAPAP